MAAISPSTIEEADLFDRRDCCRYPFRADHFSFSRFHTFNQLPVYYTRGNDFMTGAGGAHWAASKISGSYTVILSLAGAFVPSCPAATLQDEQFLPCIDFEKQ